MLAGALLVSCAEFPTGGPSRRDIDDATSREDPRGLQIVDVDDAVARRLLAQRRQRSFAETLGQEPNQAGTIGAGDAVEVTIWEAPPATLFGAAAEPRSGVST